jgi:hypothetical protein
MTRRAYWQQIGRQLVEPARVSQVMDFGRGRFVAPLTDVIGAFHRAPALRPKFRAEIPLTLGSRRHSRSHWCGCSRAICASVSAAIVSACSSIALAVGMREGSTTSGASTNGIENRAARASHRDRDSRAYVLVATGDVGFYAVFRDLGAQPPMLVMLVLRSRSPLGFVRMEPAIDQRKPERYGPSLIDASVIPTIKSRELISLPIGSGVDHLATASFRGVKAVRGNAHEVVSG